MAGTMDKVKGSVKETVGRATGNTRMQAEGKMDKVKGAAHNAVPEPFATTFRSECDGRGPGTRGRASGRGARHRLDRRLDRPRARAT